MSRKAICFVSFIMFLFIALILFLLRPTDWWRHPSFDEGIETITIFKGQFRSPNDKPVVVLNGTSVDARKVIKALQNTHLSREIVKFEAYFNLDVKYVDGEKDHILIGSNFIKFFPHGGGESMCYRMSGKDSESLRNIIKAISNEGE